MKTNGYKVSIITACYNSAAVIEDTLLSVLGQDYDNIEYVVIDGGSTDGTIELIRKYADKISYWVSEPDHGISNAWNKALTHCTGEIIGIINADDTYAIDAVSSVVREFMDNPQAGFVFGDAMMCNMKGVPLYRWQGDKEYEATIAWDMPSIPHPTAFVRREVYDKYGGFDETYKTAMDYEFLRRISANGIKGKYLPVVLVNMRLGGESDRNYARGYREVMLASVKYGYSKPKALLRYHYKCNRTKTRKTMEALGLGLLIRLFRTKLGKWYKY